jgi:small subunit ribosomal protein S17
LVTETRNNKKKKIGRVVSNKMAKTVVVVVEYYIPHRLYKKRVRHLSKFKAHDEQNACKIGDTVLIEETRPLSKDKRWTVAEILSKGDSQ